MNIHYEGQERSKLYLAAIFNNNKQWSFGSNSKLQAKYGRNNVAVNSTVKLFLACLLVRVQWIPVEFLFTFCPTTYVRWKLRSGHQLRFPCSGTQVEVGHTDVYKIWRFRPQYLHFGNMEILIGRNFVCLENYSYYSLPRTLRIRKSTRRTSALQSELHIGFSHTSF